MKGKNILRKVEKEIREDALQKQRLQCAYNNGGSYHDGYGDSGYGDYDDHACDWHEYSDD
jgi:hypothetical protein